MNKKKFSGYLAVISSAILLSLELCFLYFIQYMDKEINGSFYNNVFVYISKGPILLAFIITIILAIWGCALISKFKEDS